MGREQRTAPGVGSGNHAKERHKRDRRGNLLDWSAPLPPGLVARPEKPRISSKHKSWFEFIENKDKKKKLEFEFTDQREPPPGFEFVPIGNPALTTACKELSREQDAMIFIVTSPAPGFSNRLTRHLNRVGHHIRQGIVEQARASLGDPEPGAAGVASGLPEPIPEKQEDINKQADAAIRDLFPRIPNTDRQMIIEHAFNKSRLDGKGDPPVGLAPDLTLSRRVQLAVLAHIRHNHTRYDQLLRETTYVNARKAVESLCLDILVKWRGDEETGRDQLDEILCEVVVISDSESDESDEDEEEDESSVTSSAEESPREQAGRAVGTNRAMVSPIDAPLAAPTRNNSRGQTLPRAAHAPQKVKKISAKARREAKWAQRGFHRYQAARDQAWHQAVERQRLETNAAPAPVQSAGLGAMGSSACHEPQPLMREVRGADGVVCSAVELRYNEHRPLDASLPPVDLPRERASRIDELQQAVPDTAYRPPQQARAQQDQPGFGPRPIVGSRAVPYGAPDVERVGYRDLDLKDYPVQSIEPASPESSSFATRLPLPYRQPEPGLAHGVDGAVRSATYGGFIGQEATAAQTHRPAYAEDGFIRLPPRVDTEDGFIRLPPRVDTEEGFIRLPPRADRSWAAPAPDQRSEPFVVLHPQPVNTIRSSGVGAAVSDASSTRHLSTWQDDEAARAGEPIVRSGNQPIWIRRDGATLRSESRPILIQDYPSPPRQPRTDFAHVSSEVRRASPTRWTSRAGQTTEAGLGWADERNMRPADSRIDQRIETLQSDFVEIVRVSNKFPRQHEPRPAPASPGRYNLRSTASRPGVTPQPHDGVVRYEIGRPPMQNQPVERVVATVQQRAFVDENAPFATEPREGYQRQERVVGIEYVHPRPHFDGRTHSDRWPPYGTEDPLYRSRSTSTVPVHLPGLPYQPHAAQSVSRRDDVITLD